MKKFPNQFPNPNWAAEDWEILLSKSGSSLSMAPDEIKNNKTLVLKAINKSSLAIEFASANLKDDLEVACSLIDSWEINCHSSPKSFIFLSDRIRSNQNFSKKALDKDLGVYRYLNKEFIVNPNFYLKVFSADNWNYLVFPGFSDNLDMNLFLNIDLSSLSFTRRIVIATEFFNLKPNLKEDGFYSDIFRISSALNSLNLEYWEICHCDELILFRDFPRKREKTYRDCKELGKNCPSCHPPF